MYRRTVIPTLLVLLFTLYPREASAYVDPGTGGYIFQVLFIAFSAILAALALFRSKIESVLGTISNFIKSLFKS